MRYKTWSDAIDAVIAHSRPYGSVKSTWSRERRSTPNVSIWDVRVHFWNRDTVDTATIVQTNGSYYFDGQTV